MSRVVWKQSFVEYITSATAEIPDGYRLLHAGCDPAYQHGSIAAVWYECDPTSPRVTVEFSITMTGEELELGDQEYVGTVLFNHGIVGHIYARRV